MNHCGLAIPKI